MATADSVKAKLQALITKANNVTGNTDADLTMAIDSLVAGFGQGGGIPYATGSFTLAQNSSSQTITHNLNSTCVLSMWAVHEPYVVFSERYRAVMGVSISNGMFPTRIVDVSSYNTAGLTETEIGPTNVANIADSISAYTSSSGSPSLNAIHIDNTDPNTFTLRTRENFLKSITYDWIAMDISGVKLPWTEEATE